MNTLEGIDVYEGQGKPDWKKVAKSGRTFALAKATEGLGHEDGSFAYNWQRMHENGLLRFAYHFLRSNLDGAQQASYCHSFVRAHGRFAVGDAVALDVETTDGVSGATVIAQAERFVLEMLKETQCGIFIYVGSYFWRGQLQNVQSTILARCPWWVPSYGSEPQPCINWPHGPTLWQYSDTGNVPGVVGPCDLDRAFCDRPTLARLMRNGGR